MDHTIDYYTPLRSYFLVPDKYLDANVSSLSLYTLEDDYRHLLNRTIAALSANRYSTLKFVLAATRQDICKIRNLGTKSQLLLLELLQRVSGDPERLELMFEEIKSAEIAPKKADALIEKYSNKHPPSFDEVLKRVRLNEIKRKLRSTGMIT